MVARGFTLTELMVTLAVFSVLGAVAAPSMHTLVDKQRVSSASTDLFTALMRTRSEAIRRNTEVTLSPASAGWADGWLIPDPANSAVVFETHGAVAGATITGPTRVVYLANGRIKGSSAPAFNLSGRNGVGPRCIKVDLSGRPNQKNTAC
jgi:type IV fimbrial biogenesis protein FimT